MRRGNVIACVLIAAATAVANIAVPITAPQILNTNAGSDSGQDLSPRIATDGNNHWVAVWHSTENLGGAIGTDMDVFTSRSSDRGVTGTAPIVLNTTAAGDGAALDRFPSVTTDGAGNWIAVWESSNSLGGTIGTDVDILFSRSTDNGATWTPPAPLNGNA